MKEIGIYIHIPFCLSKCFYCDFVSYSNREDMIEKYTYALCNEILQNAEVLGQYKVTTIYIGGGTPSFIDNKYICQILNTIYMVIDKSYLQEVTIECNPNSITKDKIDMYKEAGINRVSIGLQSIFNDILKTIGRAHKFEDFENALNIVNESGIDNITVDLMYPLPNLTLDRLKETVDYVCSLKNKNVKHVSIYNLEVHENTKLAFLLQEGYITLPDEDEEYEMYKYIKDTLENNGYHRYEISNYALDGFEAIHNTRYWNQEEYLGFGVNASSFFGGARYSNIKDLDKYIDNLTKNTLELSDSIKDGLVDEYEELDLLSLMKEYVILSLRKIKGLDKQKFKSKFKKDVYDIFLDEINELKQDKLIDENDTNIFLTDRGLEVANIVWEKFV